MNHTNSPYCRCSGCILKQLPEETDINYRTAQAHRDRFTIARYEQVQASLRQIEAECMMHLEEANAINS